MVEMPTEAEPVRVVQGDCLEVLRTLPDGCVDAVVTDPPYPCIKREYGFWTEAEWFDLMNPVVEECRRVLKPAQQRAGGADADVALGVHGEVGQRVGDGSGCVVVELRGAAPRGGDRRGSFAAVPQVLRLAWHPDLLARSIGGVVGGDPTKQGDEGIRPGEADVPVGANGQQRGDGRSRSQARRRDAVQRPPDGRV
jgi:hypothetical protein